MENKFPIWTRPLYEGHTIYFTVCKSLTCEIFTPSKTKHYRVRCGKWKKKTEYETIEDAKAAALDLIQYVARQCIIEIQLIKENQQNKGEKDV